MPTSSALTNPEAALAHALTETSRYLPVAERVPGLRLAAWIVAAYVVLSMAHQWLMREFMASLGVVLPSGFDGYVVWGTIVNVVCLGGAITVLRTRRPAVAAKALIAIGACFAIIAVMDVLSFAVLAAAIDAFILWKIYDFYGSVEMLKE